MPAKTKRAAATARALEEDSKLSKAQWKKLDLTTLRLKCNAYSLAEGTRKQMADALYDNFLKKPSDDETPPPDSPPTSEDEDDDDAREMRNILARPESVSDLEDDDSSSRIHNGSRKNAKSQSKSSRVTSRPTISQQNKNNPRSKPSSSDQGKVKAARSKSSSSHLRSKIVVPQSPQSRYDGHRRSRSSSPTRQSKKHRSDNNHKSPSHTRSSKAKKPPTNNSPDITITRDQQAPKHKLNRHSNHDEQSSDESQSDDNVDYQQRLQLALKRSNLASNNILNQSTSNPVHQQQSVQGPSNTSGTDYHYNPQNPYHNPFTPPSIAESLLKKIEERKFVDFAELLPENQASDISFGFDKTIIEFNDDGTMTHKDHRNRKVKINSFHRWCTAWCIFAQAHLYYHLEDYYQIFQYHMLMVQHVSQYTFEACYKYDTAFRLIIQNERNVPPHKRTCNWCTESDVLRNKYLFNNPISTCSYCKTPGHSVNQCKTKKNSTIDNPLSNTLFASAPMPLMSAQIQPFAQYQQWRPRNSQPHHSFRAPNSNNNQQQRFSFHAPQNTPRHRPGSVHPSQKPCRNFNGNQPCPKPPCNFLHACEHCGATDHGLTICPHLPGLSSSNFIPTSR